MNQPKSPKSNKNKNHEQVRETGIIPTYGNGCKISENLVDEKVLEHRGRLWISKQSSICSRVARLGHPMDPVVSVQNKNVSGNTKELAKVLGAE